MHATEMICEYNLVLSDGYSTIGVQDTRYKIEIRDDLLGLFHSTKLNALNFEIRKQAHSVETQKV
jgi:hypothetical protein